MDWVFVLLIVCWVILKIEGYENGKFGDVEQKIFQVKNEISRLDKDISIIKTVLIMQHIMPQDLAQKEEPEK